LELEKMGLEKYVEEISSSLYKVIITRREPKCN
jgi:hypothetical protein